MFGNKTIHINLFFTRSRKSIHMVIIWLAPRAGKMNQILRCDWLPERARWSHLARSVLPALSRKKNFPKSHIINPLLTKLVRSRWLDISLVLFFFLRVYGPRLRLGPSTRKKENSANIQPSGPHTSSITHTNCRSRNLTYEFCTGTY